MACSRSRSERPRCNLTNSTDGTKNACSKLYAASSHAAQALGYQRIQTFAAVVLAALAGDWFYHRFTIDRCLCGRRREEPCELEYVITYLRRR
jgi:hypothetical protein